MTAEIKRPSIDEQLAAEAQDRTKLLAQLAREAAKRGGKSAKYVVVRQFFMAGELIDEPVSGHRFEWVAERYAARARRRHRTETGGHYTVRRADA